MPDPESNEYLPLRGTNVIELAGIGPLPFAGHILHGLGATVTLIERPDGVDSVIPPDSDLNHEGKTRVSLDLKSACGREELLALVGSADVLIEAHRPGVLERLGLGPEMLLARNPRLVVGRMTGWGQDGPLAHAAGHDVNYISLTGALHAIGERGRRPQIPLTLLGDYSGGALYLVNGLLAALVDVARGGRGRTLDASVLDGSAHLLSGIHSSMAAGRWRDERESNDSDGGSPFYAVYETADRRYVALSAVEDRFFAVFASMIGLPAEVVAQRRDEETWPRLRDLLEGIFRQRTRDEWSEFFDGTDACVSPVLSLREAPSHPHVRARGALVEVDGVIRAAPTPRLVGFAPESRGSEPNGFSPLLTSEREQIDGH